MLYLSLDFWLICNVAANVVYVLMWTTEKKKRIKNIKKYNLNYIIMFCNWVFEQYPKHVFYFYSADGTADGWWEVMEGCNVIQLQIHYLKKKTIIEGVVFVTTKFINFHLIILNEFDETIKISHFSYYYSKPELK